MHCLFSVRIRDISWTAGDELGKGETKSNCYILNHKRVLLKTYLDISFMGSRVIASHVCYSYHLSQIPPEQHPHLVGKRDKGESG